VPWKQAFQTTHNAFLCNNKASIARYNITAHRNPRPPRRSFWTTRGQPAPPASSSLASTLPPLEGTTGSPREHKEGGARGIFSRSGLLLRMGGEDAAGYRSAPLVARCGSARTGSRRVSASLAFRRAAPDPCEEALRWSWAAAFAVCGSTKESRP
jgi:hypothetical protein